MMNRPNREILEKIKTLSNQEKRNIAYEELIDIINKLSTDETIELSNIAGTTSASVGVLLVVTNPGIVTTSFNTTEDSDSMDFVPLFYNATKHCFAGYYGYNTNNPSFREVYWDAGLAVPVDVDPSLYGF